MTRIVLSSLVLCAAAGPLLADAKDDAMKLLAGKWLLKQKTGEREIVGLMEFTADGKVSMKVKSERGENSHSGTYKLTDADNIEVTYTIRDVSLTDRSKLKVTKTTLELTDEKGRTLRYTRVP